MAINMGVERRIQQLENEVDLAEREVATLREEAADGRVVAGRVRALDHLRERLATAQRELAEAAPESHACACGCGDTTKSTWAPGHDARLKGALSRLEKGEATEAEIRSQFAPAVLANLGVCSCCEGLMLPHESGMGPVCRAGLCTCQETALAP